MILQKGGLAGTSYTAACEIVRRAVGKVVQIEFMRAHYVAYFGNIAARCANSQRGGEGSQ